MYKHILSIHPKWYLNKFLIINDYSPSWIDCQISHTGVVFL